MADSNITVSGLTAGSAVGQIDLAWAVSDPHAIGLPTLQLDAVEVWAATTNNRANASKIAEGFTSAVHSGLPENSTRYYWIRPRNKSGYYGDWHPAGSTSGVEGKELTKTLTVPAVSSLTATSGLGQVSLTWSIADNNANGLGHLALSAVEVHAASTNDRALASKVAEGVDSAIHTGLAENATRYYWIRPRHRDGTYGAWHPLSSTGGVQGRELIKTITVMAASGLTATAGIGHISLQWTLTDPNGSGLGHLAIDQVEVHAASTNDRSLATKVAEGRTSAGHMALTEGATYFYWVRPRHRDGSFGSFSPLGSTSGVQATVGASRGLVLHNGKVVASVSGNALTVAIKTLAGTNPSSTDPVFVSFLKSDGSYVVRSITSAVSIVVPSGATLGTTSATEFIIWVVMVDNILAGVPDIGVINCKGTPILPEITVVTPSYIGTGSDNAETVYVPNGGAALGNAVPVAIMSWPEGLATAGVWGLAPEVIRQFGPGSKRPGEVIRKVSSLFAVQSGTAVIQNSSDVPGSSDGDVVTGSPFAISGVLEGNYYEVSITIPVSHSVAGAYVVAALHKGSAAVVVNSAYIPNTATMVDLTLKYRCSLDSLGGTPNTIRIGGSTAGTWYIGRAGSGTRFGGLATGMVTIEEIQG